MSSCTGAAIAVVGVYALALAGDNRGQAMAVMSADLAEGSMHRALLIAILQAVGAHPRVFHLDPCTDRSRRLRSRGASWGAQDNRRRTSTGSGFVTPCSIFDKPGLCSDLPAGVRSVQFDDDVALNTVAGSTEEAAPSAGRGGLRSREIGLAGHHQVEKASSTPRQADAEHLVDKCLFRDRADFEEEIRKCNIEAKAG